MRGRKPGWRKRRRERIDRKAAPVKVMNLKFKLPGLKREK